MQALQRTLLLVLQILSFMYSMDRQRFNETHPTERNALSFLSPAISEIPLLNWIVGALCALYEGTARKTGRHWFWQFRAANPRLDPAVSRVRTLNTAVSIPIALLFVFINATEIYFRVLDTYPPEKSWGMLAVNSVLFMSAGFLIHRDGASETRSHPHALAEVVKTR